MASSGAGSCSVSTYISPLGVPWASVGGSSGCEVLPHCLRVEEGGPHPFASVRAALFFGQALAWAKWGPLQFSYLVTVCLHQWPFFA